MTVTPRTPAATATHATQVGGLGKAMVIGTTGLSVEEGDEVRQAARRVPIVWAPNMSLGINLLLGLVEDVARRLAPDCNVTSRRVARRPPQPGRLCGSRPGGVRSRLNRCGTGAAGGVDGRFRHGNNNGIPQRCIPP